MAEQLDDVMADALSKIARITQHLRRHDLPHTANRIGKITQEMVGYFSDAVDKLREHGTGMGMDDGLSPSPFLSDGSTSGSPTANGNGGVSLKDSKTPPKDREVQRPRSPKAVASSPPGEVETPVSANTWAKVAGALSRHDVALSLPVRARYPTLSTNTPPIPQQPAVPTGNIRPIETDEERAGVVFVTGRFRIGSLNYLTSRILEGPLFGVDISYNNGFAQIVFQRAKHAIAFVERNKQLIGEGRHGCFGQGYKVASIQFMDWTDEIRQMENRPKERRRLTFARAGLLGEKLSFKKFQADLVAVASTNGIDLIWAFNAGNITAVFKDVNVARRVQKHYLDKAANEGPYKGVQVTFSQDPCEKQMLLGSQGSVPVGHSAALRNFSRR